MAKIKDSITEKEWNQIELLESQGKHCEPDFEQRMAATQMTLSVVDKLKKPPF